MSTPILGLALPPDGTTNWGTLVNSSVTALLDSAVGGTTTLSVDSDVVLTATDEVANQARQAILLCTGARTATRTITAPARSKVYVVINSTSGGYAVNVVGVGPTVGVSIPTGATAVIAWNGTDFVKINADSVTLNGVQTLTNKTIVKRVVSVGAGSSITPDADAADIVTQVNAGPPSNLSVNAPTGSPVNGQSLVLRLSSPSVQTFVWNPIYQGSVDLALPTASSGSSKTDYLGFIYNSTANKWQLLAKNFGF